MPREGWTDMEGWGGDIHSVFQGHGGATNKELD